MILLVAAMVFGQFQVLFASQPKATFTAKSFGKKVAGDTAAGLSNRNAIYWYKKGTICATYGNDRAAVGYFGKAIKYDPWNDKIYFEMGISYGEMGEYEKAMIYINKALKFNPQKGLYFYGRGRVWLLSGNEEKAKDDFVHAANLGNTDAYQYLRDNHNKSLLE
jgi:tetratricopeptide (TPR) repeat protein